ncbi:MAG: outer membrane beta-barrel protein [Dysgonomonas sp.]|nr:outer membrane beta-barrel protein [Dysgonomonas sp.]
MKRLYFIATLLMICLCLFSQKSSVVIDLAYRTKFEYTNWGIGGQFRYNLPHNLRLAGELTAYFPEESDVGLDVGVNLQYTFHLNEKITLYPLVGAIMSNHSFSAEPNSRNQTEFGVAMGAGAEYNFGRKSFINLDYKYYLIDKEKPSWYRDYAVIKLGYGFRF